MHCTRRYVLLSGFTGLLAVAGLAWWLPGGFLAPSATQQGLRALERGDVPAGIARLAEGVEYDPQSTWAWYHLGLGLLLAGQSAEAERSFRAALVVDPRNSWAMNNLAVSLAVQGRRREARDVLRRLVAYVPRWDQARKNLAQITREMERP